MTHSFIFATAIRRRFLLIIKMFFKKEIFFYIILEFKNAILRNSIPRSYSLNLVKMSTSLKGTIQNIKLRCHKITRMFQFSSTIPDATVPIRAAGNVEGNSGGCVFFDSPLQKIIFFSRPLRDRLESKYFLCKQVLNFILSNLT